MEPKKRSKRPVMPSYDSINDDLIAGLSVHEIGEKYGASYTAAYNWIKDYGFQINTLSDYPPPIMELEDLLKRFPRSTMAEMYGVTIRMMIVWLIYYGLMEKHGLHKNQLPHSVRDYAMNQYFLGLWDVEDIAEEYGVSVRGVRSDIRAYSYSEDMVHMMPSREELLKDYENMNLKQLAEYYGTTQPQIVKWFRSLSIKQKEAKQNV